MNIVIGNDHTGVELKFFLIDYLKSINYNFINVGTDSIESVNYPDFAHECCNLFFKKKCDFGIIICGSGNGINMTANKHKKIRSALCWNSEIASLARQHNNANFCAIPAHYVSNEEAKKILITFFKTKFEGGRHEKRINKIENFENYI